MSATTVQSFYIAYYGRPADPSGLEYWVGRVEAEGGSFDSLVAAFGTSAEATELFSGLTDAQKINAVYQATFGRDADAEGLAFYSAGLADGTFSVYDISKRILDGATSGDDAAIVANKITVAQAFTDELAADAELAAEYVGIAATSAAKALVSTVTADAATVTAATGSLDALFQITAHALTTSTDTIEGSSGRDRISGGTATLSTGDTLQITDQIDGGDGADRLTLAVSKSFAGFQANSGFLKNVETVNLENSSPSVYSFAAKGVTGVSTYNVAGPVSVTALDSLSTAVNFSNLNTLPAAASTAITVGFADEIVTGSSDTASIGLDTTGRAGTSTTDPFDLTAGSSVNLTVASVETLALSVEGANFISLAGSSSTKNVTATGEGSLLVDATTPASLRTIDASAMSGAVSLDLTGRSSNAMTSVKTGSGADTIKIDASALRADATIAGGDGADTLHIANSTSDFGASGYTMTGVETLRLSGTTGTVSFSATNVSGLSTIRIDNTVDGNVSVTGAGSDDLIVDLRAKSSGDAETKATIEGSGIITVQVNGGTSSTAATSVDSVVASKASSVVVDLPAYNTFAPSAADFGVSAAAATSATIQGAGVFNHTWTSDTDSGLNIPKAQTLTIDQSSTTATGWTVGVVSDTTTPVLKNLSVTTKSTNAIDVHGALSGTATNAFANLEVLTVDTATHFDFDDTASTVYNLPDITSVTLGGTASASQVTLGNLGANSLTYGVSLTASGLKGGLTVGTVKVGAGQNITVDLTGMSEVSGTSTTDITIGAMQETSAATNVRTGTITVNAAGMASEGDVSLATSADIFAKNVVVDFTSASNTGAMKLSDSGTITADTITINSPSAPSSLAIGTLAVKSSLTYVAPTTVAATGTVAVTAAGTSFTGALTGGLGADKFAITGGASTAAFTVSGAMGDGSDTVTITAAAKTGTTGVTIDVSNLTSAATTLTGSSLADTITGSASADVIKGGAGGDVLTGGGGKDLFDLLNAADTGSVIGATTVLRSGSPVDFTAAAYSVTAGDYLSTSGMDKIMDFSATDGDVIGATQTSTQFDKVVLQTFGQVYGTGKDTATSLSSQTDTVESSALNVYISGNYDSSANTFTFSSSGTSTLYLFDGDGSFSRDDVHGIVLVGFTAGGSELTTAPSGYDSDMTGLLASSLIS
jgi:hypothetical protein